MIVTPPSSPQPSSPRPIRTPIVPVGRSHRLRRVVSIGGGAVLIILIVSGWLAYRAISVVNTKKIGDDGKKQGFFQQISHILGAGDQQLQGEAEDRINMLLLGIGGPGHDGPYLTDTMIVASIKPSTHQVAMLSIPRDLVVNVPGYDYRKINNVLSFGRDQAYPGGGEALTVKVVSDLLNIPIHYYARVDFQGFEEIIDKVNGVNVSVENTFADASYPTNNYGYQTIRFLKGVQTMDGATALKFARSRHGNNGEGSDFARARRQQKILVALKDKILSFGTLANPKKVSDILGALGSHSQTSMEVWEMLRLARMAGTFDADHIYNKVLDDGPAGLLKADTGLGGAFILVPKSKSYDDIRFLANNIFLAAAVTKEQARVLVVNASKYTGIGDAAVQALAGFDVHVAKAANLKDTTITTTVIVDASGGQFPQTLAFLNAFRHNQRTYSLAEWTEATNDTLLSQYLEPVENSAVVNSNVYFPPNLILVLGQDQPKDGGTVLSIPTQKKSTNTNTTTTNANTNTTNKNTNTTLKKTTNTNSTNTSVNKNTNTGLPVHATNTNVPL